MEVAVDMQDYGPHRRDRLSVNAQAKITQDESDQLDDFVQWCRSRGIEATRSTAIRTFMRSGLRAVRDQMTELESESR
jgi:hypothetical protein